MVGRVKKTTRKDAKTQSHEFMVSAALRLCAFARGLLLLVLLPVAVAAAERVHLADGWRLQSSAKINGTGDAISKPGFPTDGWTDTRVPSTVLAAQVAAGQFEDPYYAMNLRKIPGTTYGIGDNFANLAMPADSPYAVSWWYRTEFKLPKTFAGKRVWLHFDGINYRANIWLNGEKVASADDVAGPYRIYDFTTESTINRSGTNVLAVEVFAPGPDDLGINWVDWNPQPPDKDMGLWGGVSIDASGPVTVIDPQVVTHFSDSTLEHADLTVMAQIGNAGYEAVSGVLTATIDGVSVRKKLTLTGSDHQTVVFAPEEYPALRVDHPAVWWPAPLGPQNLHTLELTFSANGKVSDRNVSRFGIREVSSELTTRGARLFRINRRPNFIKGAGWAPDMMLRKPSRERLRTELQYVRDMNLNTVRLEGKMESDEFLDLCDEMGILVMAGWCCCDHWEMWDKWTPADRDIANHCLWSQALRMRRHPSVFTWLNGSDNPPPPDVERMYLDTLNAAKWAVPYVSSATATPTTVTGDSGVKMNGPYDFVAPSYWLRDKEVGGAFNFATEIGPGPAIPTVGSIRRMLPADHLWPIDEYWNFHAGGSEFKTLATFNAAMNATYGEPSGLDDYVNKAQAMAYDGERAMFEAYTRNKYSATGVIQWMLNNAWPSMIWHLYDYYLQPAGGYYGTKKACEPLHIQYSYDDHSVVVANSLYTTFRGMRARATLYDLELHEKFTNTADVTAFADTSKRVFEIPASAFEGSEVTFLKLTLENATGKVVSTNFYWLPARYTEFDYPKTTYVNTPAATHEDMRALGRLPRVTLDASARATWRAGELRVTVRIRNGTGALAFQPHMSVLVGPDLQEAAPIFWTDNYCTLLPGETRVVEARVPAPVARGPVAVQVDGLNIETAVVPIAGAKRAGAGK